MAKLGFFIQSSNQELFKNNTEVLKEYYRQTIKDNSFDIELFSFTSDENATNIYEVGDTIYCNCNDGDVFSKHYLLFKYIQENKKYDWMLFTNNTTLVNIFFLYYNIAEFNHNIYYCLNNVNNKIFGEYPNGNFKLMGFDMFLKILGVFETAKICLTPLYDFLYGVNKTPYKWYGVPEDLIIGRCLNKIQTSYMTVASYNYASLFDYLGSRIVDINQCADEWYHLFAITFRTPCYICGNEVDNYNYRLENETNLLKQLINKIQENNE